MKHLILDIIKDHNYCSEVDLLNFLNPINPEVFAFTNLHAFSVNDTSHLPIFCRWCYKTDLGYINLLQVEGRFYVLDSLIYSDLNNIFQIKKFGNYFLKIFCFLNSFLYI